MDDGSKPPLIQLFVLLCFSAYLAFAETSLASVSKNKVKVAADRGDNRAIRLLWALDNFDRAITTILICNNITSLTIATIVTIFVTSRWGISAVSVGTLVTTIVIFFACEMLPKTLAKRYSYRVSLSCSGFLCLLMHVFKPFSAILTAIGHSVSEHSKDDSDVSVTEDEIQNIIEDMAEEGSLDENQSNLISSALQFGDVKAKDILTPRVDIQAIDISDSQDDILAFVRSENHSRIPVYEGSVDNIVGILGIRKYMKAFVKKGKAPAIKPILDKVFFVHGNTEIHELLPLMSRHKTNIVVVKDEYGGTLGIITVEDILEELVGDIYDESDVVEKTQENVDKTNFIDSEVVQEEEK